MNNCVIRISCYRLPCLSYFYWRRDFFPFAILFGTNKTWIWLTPFHVPHFFSTPGKAKKCYLPNKQALDILVSNCVSDNASSNIIAVYSHAINFRSSHFGEGILQSFHQFLIPYSDKPVSSGRSKQRHHSCFKELFGIFTEEPDIWTHG